MRYLIGVEKITVQYTSYEICATDEATARIKADRILRGQGEPGDRLILVAEDTPATHRKIVGVMITREREERRERIRRSP